MPKKHTKVSYSKPSIPVHPSLSSSTHPSHHGAHAQAAESSPTVNALIQHLRRSQTPSTTERHHSDSNPHPSVHPSLKSILQVPDTPSPRPRPQAAPPRRQRGPAGPPPPLSWLEDSIHAPKGGCESSASTDAAGHDVARRLDRLPGIYLPAERSLVHQTLRSMARNWAWHLEYDQYYVATLPELLKQALLAYVTVYSPHGTTRAALELLFLGDAALADATGSEAVTHLDFSGAAVLKDLSRIFEKQPPTSPSLEAPLSVPDTWDTPSPSPLHAPTIRFPTLTHLSLAHPPSPSWRALLSALPHLRTLTHLSLAHWPAPSLTPNAQTATLASPTGSVQYGGSAFYSASDGDWSEAAGLLRRLGRGTLCLKWLDLDGCVAWVAALGWTDAEGSGGGGGGVDWAGSWRGVEIVRCAQGWVPRGLQGPNEKGPEKGEDGGGEAGRARWDVERERRRYREKVAREAWVEREVEVRRVEARVGQRRRGRAGRVVFEKTGVEERLDRWLAERSRGGGDAVRGLNG
ncbi:hypothetical protein MMC34_002058 [Xylographa carneopallida]|nr:hypothetical protein [Xylographa carneopallida]